MNFRPRSATVSPVGSVPTATITGTSPDLTLTLGLVPADTPVESVAASAGAGVVSATLHRVGPVRVLDVIGTPTTVTLATVGAADAPASPVAGWWVTGDDWWPVTMAGVSAKLSEIPAASYGAGRIVLTWAI